MRIMQEKIFGPVVDVLYMSNLHEAVVVVDDIEFRLSVRIAT